MTNPISNTEDVIDSRDVIARIEELEENEERDEEETEELVALQALAKEGEASPDWTYGETLINDDYFPTYAQDLAEDVGAITPAAAWPLTYIDWDAAADALKMDYISVDFDGAEYWVRA